MKTIILLLTTLLFSAGDAHGAGHPNVILILSDDLKDDPGEATNLAAQHPDIVVRLRRLHEQHLD